MLSTMRGQGSFCLVLGVFIALASVQTMGYTMAIVMPMAFLDWFKSRDLLAAGLLLWGTTVSVGLAIVPMVFATLLAAFRFAVKPTLGMALLFMAGFLLGAYVAVPVVYDMPFWIFDLRRLRDYAIELSVVVATVGALLVARRLWPERSLEPKPHRTAD